MGRFINRDPIEEKGGLNLYAYCQNNAINTYDVLGMYTQTRWNSGSPTNADPTGEDDGGGDDGMYNFEMEREEEEDLPKGKVPRGPITVVEYMEDETPASQGQPQGTSSEQAIDDSTEAVAQAQSESSNTQNAQNIQGQSAGADDLAAFQEGIKSLMTSITNRIVSDALDRHIPLEEEALPDHLLEPPLGENSAYGWNDETSRWEIGAAPLRMATYQVKSGLKPASSIVLSSGNTAAWRAVSSSFANSGLSDTLQKSAPVFQAIGEYSTLGIGGVGTVGGKIAQKTAAEAAKRGAYSVYKGFDTANKVRYVGITSRKPAIRFAEHASSKTAKSSLRYEVIKGAEGLSKIQARVWEQTLINQYGLQKNGGLLLNKINSIASKYWWQYGIQ